ncbi:MAG TPA: hypothetical protein VEA40_06010 [Ramlibacter sp.]|nr:hypothetical protein [Ramlibacter sp.]
MDASWNRALREGLVEGTLASVLSAGLLALVGRRQAGSAAAPINAVSHWAWGDESLRQDGLTVKHTLLGFLTHHLAATFWATLHARLWGGRPGGRTVPQALVGGLVTSAAAAAIDYTLVPKRLTPGFEHRVSRGAMVGAFGAIALGVAVGALLMRERD